jgi:ATP-dependent Clp protease ATP-binding subunit ClpA
MLNLNSYYTDDRFGDYSNEDEDEEDKGPALEIYGTDLTLLAKEGKLEECFGREQELLEMMEILVRRQKNNPVLVGDAGVGKTAIVELFATKIVNNLVPFVLEGRTLISLDLARIVAGSRYRGEFELRFQKVLDEVLAQPNVIIFIDEIHNIGGTGSAEGSLDAANILKPVLSRSGFQCIGATTTKEYQRIEKDPALNRRFQPIKVKEPSIEETVNILYGLRPSLEAFHNVEILPGAIRLAADLSARYIYDRFLPDKAIDLIDRAAAKEVIRLTNVTEGSVIASLANAGLNNIGALRVEAFRRGDIASEFVFQEIENAYRNFLLRWIEEPLTIPEEAKLMLSPISQNLFDKMRMSVLKRVDDLLFSSSQIRTKTQKVNRIKDLSIEKKIHILSKKTKGKNPLEKRINCINTLLINYPEFFLTYI